MNPAWTIRPMPPLAAIRPMPPLAGTAAAPEQAQPLSAIVRQEELREHGRITEIEYDHGVW